MINFSSLRVACSNCNLREACLPTGLTLKEIERLEDLVTNRRRVKRGDALFRAGDRFENLYAVRLGFLKSTVMSSDGREQVTNFYMAGELIGLDGISSGVHSCDVVALEDTEVCVVPYDRLEEVATSMRSVGAHLLKRLSREVVRQRLTEALPQGATAPQRHMLERGARHAAESGVWLSAADGGSVHLVDGDAGRPVTYPDGEPVAFSLRELAAIAADRRRAGPESPAGLYNRLSGEGR